MGPWESDEFVTVGEAAEILGFSTGKVRRRVLKDPAVKYIPGRPHQIKKDTLRAWQEKQMDQNSRATKTVLSTSPIKKLDEADARARGRRIARKRRLSSADG